jgi:transposase-like protein
MHQLERCLVAGGKVVHGIFDFPAEHWDHLRTSNPIESVFATVRPISTAIRACSATRCLSPRI